MATLTRTVAASADDAYERGDNTGFSAVIATMQANSVVGGIHGIVAFRFNNITITGDATINTAVLRLTCASTKQDDANVVIYCEDVDDSANFTDTADVVDRARTTASTSWVTDGLGTSEVTSPDFAAAVQEVIDRASWASGNDLTVIFVGNSDTFKNFGIFAEDDASGAPASIDLDYTEPGGGANPKNVMHGIMLDGPMRRVVL